MARISFSLSTRYSSPSSLNSVPPYLANSKRSPSRTYIAARSPLSSRRPLPTAIPVPSWGFSLAVSGITMPLLVTSSFAAGLTTTRSPTGRIFATMILSFSQIGQGGGSHDESGTYTPLRLLGFPFRCVVNNARNGNRTVLRVVTVAGTSSRTACAAVRFPLDDSWRPENLNITVGATHNLLLRTVIIATLWLVALCVHILWPVS